MGETSPYTQPNQKSFTFEGKRQSLTKKLDIDFAENNNIIKYKQTLPFVDFKRQLDRTAKKENTQEEIKKILRDKNNLAFASVEQEREIQKQRNKNEPRNPFNNGPNIPGLKLLDAENTNDEEEEALQKRTKTLTGEKPKTLIQRRGEVDIECDTMMVNNVKLVHQAVRLLRDQCKLKAKE